MRIEHSKTLYVLLPVVGGFLLVFALLSASPAKVNPDLTHGSLNALLAVRATTQAEISPANTMKKSESNRKTEPLRPVILYPSRFRVSPPLRDIPPQPPKYSPSHEIKNRIMPKINNSLPSKPNPRVQNFPGQPGTPAPLLSVEGLSNADNGTVIGFQLAPPDTEGDVSPNHYFQWVNLIFAIWDKNGNKVYPPQPGPPAAAGNTFWAGFGGPCETDNDGDPIVLWDHDAQRWFVSQFSTTSPYRLCMALTTTSDPTGTWYQWEYVFSNNKFPDYHKWGVWPDAYYSAFNQFLNLSSWAGQGALALERAKMIAGDPAPQAVYFDLFPVNNNYGGQLPSHWEGPTPPPTGTPNYYIEWDDAGWIGNPVDYLSIWEFHVDWTTPANSTFGINGDPNQQLATQDVDPAMCNFSRDCIPQPGTTQRLDAISDRLMYRLQYRNFGSYQTLVVNHTIDENSADHAAPHWYELRNTGTGWSIFQEGTYAPDSDHRWMGSAAMDASGNIALGFTVASSTTYPSVRYATRNPSDPPGTLQAEQELVAGGGAQLNVNRWGDYSTMSVDPTDDCTFWYTQEYVNAPSGSWKWNTRFGSFKDPSCVSGPSATIQGTVTDASTSLPIQGATVVADVYSTTTDSNGQYSLTVAAPGTYNVTASKFGYQSSTVPGVTVNDGDVVTLDFALQPVPLATVTGTVTDSGAHGWPLYASLQIVVQGGGFSTTIYTDPWTGAYSIDLPESFTYDFTVNAVLPGYSTELRAVTVNPGGQTENFALTPVSPPGYTCGLSEDFSNGIPATWTIINGGSCTATWTDTNPGGRSIGSPFSGTFAIADSDDAGPSCGTMDEQLISPSVDASALTTVILEFSNQYRALGDVADVDVSIDGGTNWTNVLRMTSSNGYPTPNTRTLDISAIAAGQPDVKIRWHYYNANWAWWWAIDNVSLPAPCTPIPGGLVAGYVNDANLGTGIVGATVSDDVGGSTTSVDTPNDPNVGDGFYYMFTDTSTGTNRTYTASKTGYASDIQSFTVVPDTVNRLDFALGAGLLQFSPLSMFSRQNPGTTEHQTLTVTNSGGLDAAFKLLTFELQGFVPSAPQDPVASLVPPEQSTALTTKGLNLPVKESKPTPGPNGQGDVIQTWPTGLTYGWGLDFDTIDNTVWISDLGVVGGTDMDWEYDTAGTQTGDSIDVSTWIGSWAADMAHDPINNKIWEVNVSGDNCIYELDPVNNVSTGNNICWGATTSERGLAYDPMTDTFFVGGWNTTSVTRFDRSGTVLQSVNVGIAIAGLAYNPSTGHLFAIENSPTDTVHILDVNNNYAEIGSFTIAGMGSYGGAGLEFDCNGHLWVVNQQTQMVLEVDSGEIGTCPWAGIPWLIYTPTEGTVPANGGTLPVDAEFLPDQVPYFGSYRARTMILHNTPYTYPDLQACMYRAFWDVPPGYLFDKQIHSIAGNRITYGCGGGNFCPSDLMTRGVKALWLLRARYGPDYSPPPCTGIFSDVPCETTANADYIEALFNEGITSGCFYDPGTGERRYCPNDPVLRAQMAVFLLKAKEGSAYTPPACTGIFTDVPCPSGFADWIEELANRGITSGCTATQYCPMDNTLRGQMAKFVQITWNLPSCP